MDTLHGRDPKNNRDKDTPNIKGKKELQPQSMPSTSWLVGFRIIALLKLRRKRPQTCTSEGDIEKAQDPTYSYHASYDLGLNNASWVS